MPSGVASPATPSRLHEWMTMISPRAEGAEDHRLGMAVLAHGSQGVAAEAIRTWRALEDAEIDQEPETDAHSAQRADPTERVGLVRRSGKPERLQQARDQDRDQAVKGGDARLVAILEALSRHRISRIEQGDGDKGHQYGAKSRGPENGADDEAGHDADDGEDDGSRPVFRPVDAPVERREEIFEIQIHWFPPLP